MIDFRLKTFLTLSRVLNYTNTAKLLHITQPAVSQHIKHLEEEYGIKLFTYNSKTLSLTRPGKMLYDFLLAMEVSSNKMKEKLSSLDSEELALRFGTTLTVGGYRMKKILPKLLCDFPKRNISMEVGNTKTLLESLRSGKIDFAILEGYFDKSEYEWRLFSKERFIGVCSPLHEFKDKNISFQDILKERLILREKGSGTRYIFEQLLYEHNVTMNSFNDSVEVGNMEIIKYLVSQNMGITFLYQEAAKKEIDKGDLVKINLSDFDVEREFNFVFLKDSLHHKEYIDWFNYFISF